MPDIVFIYNNQGLHPEVLKKFKKSSKIVFFLGDSPYYSHTNDYNLQILFEANLIISPDSQWIDQLKILGLKDIVLDFPGYNPNVYFKFLPSDEDMNRYSADIIFLGRCYSDSWGYKRVLFLNYFKDFDIRIYASGHGWDKWLDYFPELRSKMLVHDRHDQHFNNLIANCAKIYPVDANPGTLAGIHMRVFDCIGSCILPLVEFRKDLESVFPNGEIPIIRDYRDIPGLCKHYLNNETERILTISKLHKRVCENYLPDQFADRILKMLFY